MKKQIEEILEIILSAEKTNSVTGGRTEYKTMPEEMSIKYGCSRVNAAIALYNAGYRKQSENIIELPCKVGDMVYVPWRWGGQRAVATVKVEEIKFYDSQMHFMFFIDMQSDDECFNQSFGGWKIDQSIGETVFLTKEEAERKIKGE